VPELVDSNYRAYDHIASAARIDKILAQPRGSYEEKESLPDRDALTYTNGFYAYCSALFVDLRESSSLPGIYNRPALAKLYRAFISETVAVLNSDSSAREVNIVGDCVWAVYNTPLKSDIDDVFSLAAETNSLMKMLNYKLQKAGYSTPIRAGIGLSYGRALMIKAGYSGSGIQDVVYMGDVVNRAAKLAAQGSKTIWTPPVMIDETFRSNLKEKNQKLTSQDTQRGCYTADIINLVMNDWYRENCK
jgi:class 3 adenylate cyclase